MPMAQPPTDGEPEPRASLMWGRAEDPAAQGWALMSV